MHPNVTCTPLYNSWTSFSPFGGSILWKLHTKGSYLFFPVLYFVICALWSQNVLPNVPPAHTHYFNPHKAVDRPSLSDSVWCSLALPLSLSLFLPLYVDLCFCVNKGALFFLFFVLFSSFNCIKATWLCVSMCVEHLVTLGYFVVVTIRLVCSFTHRKEFCKMLSGNASRKKRFHHYCISFSRTFFSNCKRGRSSKIKCQSYNELNCVEAFLWEDLIFFY